MSLLAAVREASWPACDRKTRIRRRGLQFGPGLDRFFKLNEFGSCGVTVRGATSRGRYLAAVIESLLWWQRLPRDVITMWTYQYDLQPQGMEGLLDNSTWVFPAKALVMQQAALRRVIRNKSLSDRFNK
jgi:hypothetical protein